MQQALLYGRVAGQDEIHYQLLKHLPSSYYFFEISLMVTFLLLLYPESDDVFIVLVLKGI